MNFFSFISASLAPAAAQAAGLVPCSGQECNICHLVQLLVNIGQFLIGIVGSLTLVMFLYGAFWWIISVGNADRVAHGKNIMVNAIYGVAIVFLSYLIITFIMGVFTGTNPFQDQKVLFGKTWGELITCETPTCAKSGGACLKAEACATKSGSTVSHAFEECAAQSQICCFYKKEETPAAPAAAPAATPAPTAPTPAPAAPAPAATVSPNQSACQQLGKRYVIDQSGKPNESCVKAAGFNLFQWCCP